MKYTVLSAKHPISSSWDLRTVFDLELVNHFVFIIREREDLTSGMSVTNNMEEVLETIFKEMNIMYDDIKLYTVYQLGNDGLFRIEHEYCSNPKWVYCGKNTKTLEVLYGTSK